MEIKGRNEKENTLIKTVVEYGHENVFHFWNELSDSEKDQLINDLEPIDFAQIKSYYGNFNKTESVDVELTPTDYLSIKDRSKAGNIKEIGEQALRNNEVAFLLVAGGQGSRLGYDHPKGCFDISPVKQKSLFRIFAQKIKFYSDYYQSQFKWFIMTSQLNYGETVEYFEKNDYFGLGKDRVIFFKQGMFPTLTMDGTLILSEKHRLFLNPDGHGGILKALLVNGLIDQMKNEGIKYVSYFQVDNPLVKPADPYFIGYHIQQQSRVTSKVIAKAYPEEKLGSIGKMNGKNGVIEYSDLPEDKMHQKNTAGELEYLMGSIAIHIFDVDFLMKFTDKMPIHFAKKSVKGYTNSTDDTSVYSEMDGIKFETFVFDTIPMADTSAFFETDREEEFYPLKNKEGVDSIATCLDGQKKMHFSWIQEAGLVTDEYTGQSIEISPLFAPDREIFLNKVKENAEKIKNELFDDNGNLKTEIYIED